MPDTLQQMVARKPTVRKGARLSFGPLVRRAARALRDSRGAAAVEFALIAPMLVGFLAPIADIGMRTYAAMQVEIAAQAGARYALLNGFNSSAIQSAVTNATGFTTISASPAPSSSCGCPSGNAIATATCGASCANGETAGTYVTVNAQMTFQPLFPLPVVGQSATLSSQALVRVQ
jgi:Flp pilus assembly protein TadG